jgi:protoporphyrinogen oxidase
MRTIILGAGVTGLAAGSVSGLPVYEASNVPGGICTSYYVSPDGSKRYTHAPDDGEVYRFELGGGHWIFGGEPEVLDILQRLAPLKHYTRRSSVFFAAERKFVPYPLQNHLRYLDADVREKALREMEQSGGSPATMSDWLEQTFGLTLFGLFFGPFHTRYAAGLDAYVAPQDSYKTPLDMRRVRSGATGETEAVGYNVSFVYPEPGLDTLARGLSERCDIRFGKRAVRIDLESKTVHFRDGSQSAYGQILSTLPLNKMMELVDLPTDAEQSPYTSVLVLNVGAVPGPACPDQHWLYIPDSRSGFHRVGFYSNVDLSFLPFSARTTRARTSLYVERSYANGTKPTQAEIDRYTEDVVSELQSWGFIHDVEVLDPTWIEVAYTWSHPGSDWRRQALEALRRHGIQQAGRYGRWEFQGIAESIREGLAAGRALRPSGMNREIRS